jgi:alpha-1,2-mannosyltransferase
VDTATRIEVLAALFSLFVFGADRKADLAVFLKAGGQVLHGVDPYQAPTSPLLLDGHAFVYPWLAAWLFTPLALLPSWLAGLLFTVLGIGLTLLAARLLKVPRGWAVAALLLCAPFARNAELGAVNACFFFLLAALWHWRDRTWVVAGSVTLLVGVKLFLAPVLLWVLVTRSWRCTAAAFASVAAFFLGSFALGPISLPTYLDMLHRLSDFMGHQGMSLESAIVHFVPDAPARALVLATVATGLALALLSYYKGTHDEARLLGALVVLSLAASPMVWRHYLLLPFFVLALVRPTTKALLASAIGSWIVVGSASLENVGRLTLDERFIALYLAIAALFALCVRDLVRVDSAAVAPFPRQRRASR